jgi:Helix-hairpin-helix motif
LQIIPIKAVVMTIDDNGTLPMGAAENCFWLTRFFLTLPMFNLRFFALLLSALGLSILMSCSSGPDATDAFNASSTTASPTDSAMNHGSMDHSMGFMGQQKININSAILSQLDKLEAKLGIPALSNKIQASRPYGKPEELVTKQVVTQAQFDQIKDLVTIEDIQLTGVARDVDYMTKLGLMKGHLEVAKELLDLRRPDQAEPHIGHPVEEIYADIEDQLNERQVKEFKTPLIALQDLVKAGAKDSAAVNTEFKTSVQSIDAAITKLPAAQRSDPKFILPVISGLLDTANSEYKAAIASGKITQAIEYQDSRGFVDYANSLYQTVLPLMKQKSAKAGQNIEVAMSQLTQTWPSPIPPSQPVKTPEQVATIIKKIETDIQQSVQSF